MPRVSGISTGKLLEIQPIFSPRALASATSLYALAAIWPSLYLAELGSGGLRTFLTSSIVGSSSFIAYLLIFWNP